MQPYKIMEPPKNISNGRRHCERDKAVAAKNVAPSKLVTADAWSERDNDGVSETK